MIFRFVHRVAVSSAAGAGLFAGTTAAWRLMQASGLVRPRPSRRSDANGEPTATEVVGMAASAGAFFGAGYGVVRPLLPRQPEAAGVLYALGASVAARAQLNALFKRLGRPERFRASGSRISGDLLFGLSLASAERMFGPRR
jgi:hypothetical protein